MTYRSATRAAYHLGEAVTSLTVAMDHLAKAREHDVDPARADAVYQHRLRDIGLVSVAARALVTSRQPDLDREAEETMTMTMRGKARHNLIQWQRRQMEEWSEETWCAGWITGCAEQLWHGGGAAGEMVRETAEMTGVWWVSDHEYISLDEWKRQQEDDAS